MKLFLKPFCGFISAVAGALLVVGLFHLTLWGKDTPPNITVSATPVNRDARLGTSFAPIVKKAAPSVVNIYSTRIVREQPMAKSVPERPDVPAVFRQPVSPRL